MSTCLGGVDDVNEACARVDGGGVGTIQRSHPKTLHRVALATDSEESMATSLKSRSALRLEWNSNDSPVLRAKVSTEHWAWCHPVCYQRPFDRTRRSSRCLRQQPFRHAQQKASLLGCMTTWRAQASSTAGQARNNLTSAMCISEM